jgi:hypothetical protein
MKISALTNFPSQRSLGALLLGRRVSMRRLSTILGLLVICMTPIANASAEQMKISAVMAPTKSMKLDFQDGSKHFVLLVQREGTAKGTGPLAGNAVTEYGMHDLVRGVGGEPRGYLEFKAPNGDIGYIQWQVRAVFFKGEKKPRLADFGYWHLVGGTGGLKGMTGVGTMTIKPSSKTERLFTLEGEIGPKP